MLRQSATGVSVNTATLLSALVLEQPSSQSPLFSVRDRCLRITTFPVDLTGMRVQTVQVESGDCLCFKMSDKLCHFLQGCRGYHAVRFSLEKGTLTVVAESTCSAVQVKFAGVETVEDVFIDGHAQDVGMTVPTVEWLKLWQTVPATGKVTMHCHARKKTVTLTHVSNQWAAVVQGTTAPDKAVAFVCCGHVARATLGTCPTRSTFSVLTFMHNGVLKWEVDRVEVYLAPVAGDP